MIKNIINEIKKILITFQKFDDQTKIVEKSNI